MAKVTLPSIRAIDHSRCAKSLGEDMAVIYEEAFAGATFPSLPDQ